MRVRLLLTSDKNESIGVWQKDYPLAKDEEEARSMMFRDRSEEILKIVLQGGRVQFNVEPKEALHERVV